MTGTGPRHIKMKQSRSEFEMKNVINLSAWTAAALLLVFLTAQIVTANERPAHSYKKGLSGWAHNGVDHGQAQREGNAK